MSKAEHEGMGGLDELKPRMGPPIATAVNSQPRQPASPCRNPRLEGPPRRPGRLAPARDRPSMARNGTTEAMVANSATAPTNMRASRRRIALAAPATCSANSCVMAGTNFNSDLRANGTILLPVSCRTTRGHASQAAGRASQAYPGARSGLETYVMCGIAGIFSSSRPSRPCSSACRMRSNIVDRTTKASGSIAIAASDSRIGACPSSTSRLGPPADALARRSLRPQLQWRDLQSSRAAG